MSKYNKFAKDLNEAFIEARKAFFDARKKVQMAEAEYEDMLHWDGPEDYPGQKERHIDRAKTDLEDARETLKAVNAAAWDNLKARRKELTAALQAALAADNLADPGALDMAALELMRSGIMTAADYQVLAAKYTDNATMRRLVDHNARQAADNVQDARERAVFLAVARDCADSTMQNWEGLCSIMDRCAGGRPGRAGDLDHVANMATRWEDFTREAIEAF